MSKVCVWGAWYESKNAGDQAILMTIANQLAREVRDLELVVFSNRPALTQEYMGPIFPVRAISHRHALLQVMRELRSCDLFLVGGGTPFYDDWYHLLAMMLLVNTARLAGNPVMAYAVSARPITSLPGKILARLNLKQMNKITVRERNAVSILKELVETEIPVFTDPALTLEPVDEQSTFRIFEMERIPLGKKPMVAVCPHFFSPDHPYHVHHYEPMSAASIAHYHRVLASISDWLAENYQVVFVPLNVEAPDDDREAIREISMLMDRWDHCYQIHEPGGPREIAGILKRCEISLTVRLHAAVLSSAVLTLPVAISYGPKVQGFMQTLGLEDYSIQLEELTENLLKDKVSLALSNQERCTRHLEVRVEQLKTLAGENARVAASLLENEW